MEFKSLNDIRRQGADVVLAGIRDPNPSVSKDAGLRLVSAASGYGLNLRDYLTLAVDPEKGDTKGADMSGYEASLVHLQLPVKNDFRHGITLEAAANTFQTFTGSRALFPEVVDDMLKWLNRQVTFESVQPFLANSRTINAVEMIHTLVNDDSADRKTFTVSELGRIPIRNITTTQNAVGIFKHGSGYRTSYEFQRRVRMDVLVPFANRVARELELSKVVQATGILINGDGTTQGSAAGVVTQSSFSGQVANVTTVISYERLLRWLVSRAKLGVPVDVVVGNYKALVDWIMLFTPTIAGNVAQAEALAAKGGAQLSPVRIPDLLVPVEFALSNSVPDNQLVGITKGETLEELVEAGSLISESENSILNQSITYVRTENTGYKLAFYDTRSVYNYGA
jgi:hypothetical protein